VGKHLFAALFAEGVEALAAQLLQLIALAIAQFVAADQAVGAVAVGGDAVAGEHLAHHALHPFGVVVDLGHVLAQDPAGHILRWGGAAAAEQFQQHQGLVDVAHAHALGDVLAQPLVGGGGGRRHGVILAGVRRGVALVDEKTITLRWSIHTNRQAQPRYLRCNQ
jgi:hypothetical protein